MLAVWTQAVAAAGASLPLLQVARPLEAPSGAGDACRNPQE